MDKIDVKTRSRNMAKIKAKNTKPELLLRKSLYNKGYRYRIHYSLRGRPDIVFPKKRIAVFVNGCFWHGHGCKFDHKPKSNMSFWTNKIVRNKERDVEVKNQLSKEGWSVISVWECEVLKDINKISNVVVKNIDIKT